MVNRSRLRIITSLRWMLVILAGVAGSGFWWMRRRGRRVDPPADAVLLLPAPTADPLPVLPAPAEAELPPQAPPVTTAPRVEPWHWLLFAACIIVCAALLMILPRPYNTGILVALVLSGVLIAARMYLVQAAVGLVRGVRAAVRWIRRMTTTSHDWLVARGVITGRVALIGAVILFGIGAFYAQPGRSEIWNNNTADLERGLVFFALGLLLCWLGVYLHPDKPEVQAISDRTLTPDRTRWRLVGAGVAVLWFVAEVSGKLLADVLPLEVSHHWQFVGLIAGIGMVIVGLGGVTVPAARRWLETLDYRTVVILLLLTLLALGVRFWQLEDAMRLFVDELNFVAPLMEFWYEDDLPLLRPFSSTIAFPYLYPYMEAQLVALLGRTFTGLRAVSVIFGALTVPALYGLAQAVFNRRVALVAALLLAVFPPHIHFSRLALNNIAEPLFGTLAFAFVLRGMQSNRRLDYAIGGAALGLTQYFYEGGRLLYPPLMVAWCGLAFVLARHQIRRHWRGILIAALAALIVAAPVYYTLIALDMSPTRRLDQVGLNGEYWQRLASRAALDPYVDHLIESVLVYFNLPEGSRFYGGPDALVLPLLVPLLMLGLALVVYRWRRAGALLLVLWIAVTSLGNSLMVASAYATRYVVVFPALVLLIAVGLDETLRMVWPERRVNGRLVLLALVTGVLVVGQADYYFGPQLTAFNRQIRMKLDGNDALLRSLHFPPTTQIHIIAEPVFGAIYARSMMSYFNDDYYVNVITPGELDEHYLRIISRDRDNAFFLESTDMQSLELIREQFALGRPQGSPYELPPHRELVLFYAPCCLTGAGVIPEETPAPEVSVP
jgi:4-amino-4-deoxy-L-arabinose transferase-like glycosyltransferase